MLHKAWSSIEEVPYCFWRSSVKFQGHTALEGQGSDAEVKGRDKLYADKRHHTFQSSIKPGAEVWENESNQ